MYQGERLPQFLGREKLAGVGPEIGAAAKGKNSLLSG